MLNSVNNEGIPTYVLDGGADYEVRVYHYHPKQHFPGFVLEVSADESVLESLNGESRVFNTRYDRKDYQFKANKSVLGQDTRLAFQRKELATGKLIWEDFQIAVRVRPSIGLALLSIGVTATGFAIPFVVRSLTDPNKDWPVILGAIVGGALVGAITIAKDDYNRAITMLNNAWDKAKRATGVR